MPVYTTATIAKNSFIRTQMADADVNELIDEAESKVIDDIGYAPAATDKTMSLIVNLYVALQIQARDPSSIAVGGFRITNDPRGTSMMRQKEIDTLKDSLMRKSAPPTGGLAFIWKNQP